MLETDRLLLRPFTRADAHPFEALSSDPRMMRTIGTGEVWSPARSLEWVEKQARRFAELGFAFLAMVEPDTGELVGISGVQKFGTSELDEIGWWVRRDRWGRGYATEAARRVRDWAFDSLDMESLNALALPDNRASVHVMRKIGMVRVGECLSTELGGAEPAIRVVHYRMRRGEAGTRP